jgi:hypothetical protein
MAKSRFHVAIALTSLLVGCDVATSEPTAQSAAPPSGQTPPVVAPAKPAAVPPRSGGTPGLPPPAQVPAGPISAEPRVVDFGVVKPDELLTAKVRLLNPTDQPVKVAKAVPSCQCTGLDIEGKVIPARGELEMALSMKMSKAPIRKFADVKLMFEGMKQILQVQLAAEVAYAVRADPPFVDITAGKPRTGTFTLSSVDGNPFSVLSMHGKPPVFVGFDSSKDAPRPSYVLQYDFSTLTGNAPKFLVIETDRAEAPVIDLRVRHETTHIKPPVKLGEFRSNAGRIAPGAKGEFELEIEQLGSNRVTGVRSLWDGAAVSLLDQRGDGKNVVIRCEVAPAATTTGMFLFPVEISIGATKFEHMVLGAVR